MIRQLLRGEPVPDLYYRADAPSADFEEADPAGPRRTTRSTWPSAGPSMPRWRARDWTTRWSSGRRSPRCAGYGSTWWRSTRATTGMRTCSARPSTARPASQPGRPRAHGPEARRTRLAPGEKRHQVTPGAADEFAKLAGRQARRPLTKRLLVQVRPAEKGLAWRAVHLTPSDQDKLLLAVAGMVARDRRERGVLLNHPEAVALLSCWVIERARDGTHGRGADGGGRAGAGAEEVMEGVPEMLDEVQVEATFPDGRKLVTLHEPVAMRSRARCAAAPAELELNAGRERREARGRQHRRPADPGRLALPLRRRQRRAGVRPRAAAGLSARHAGGHVGALRAGRPRPVALVALAGARTVPGLR